MNPQGYYSSEPAPMGIADFGVDQNGNGYTYNTTSFFADLKMSKLTTSGTNSGTSVGFQLNVVMVITNGSQTYDYWVQDVAVLDTSTLSLGFENNIWNFSASSSGLPSNTVAGNGSIYGSQYYAAGASSQSGASITISYPFDLGLRVDTATVSGSPAARFEYSDGYGWITYDVAHFPWAKGFKNHGYVVDGTQYNPSSLYNDAELILGGDCCGYNTQVTTGALHLALEYWNGHNYQMVRNAYNHGSDTAEGVSNITSAGRYYPSNGTLYANLSAAGAQSLGVLYDRATAAIVNISTPYQNGIIYFNGTKYGAFIGGEMNLTVGPGSYAIGLYENATRVGVENVTVPKGGYVPVYFGAGSKYSATFTETGLPTGTNWSVTTSGMSVWSTTNQIVVPIWNGTWSYHLGLVNGWVPGARNGQVTIAGAANSVSTAWTRTVYNVKFTSVGLPSGQTWSVTVNGTSIAGPNPTLTFLEPNGTFAYQVGAVGGFVPDVRAGSVTVAAGALYRTVQWSAFTYPVTFTSTGLPSGAPWNVTVGTATYSTSNASLTVPAANGTHAWVLGIVPGYHATQGGSGSFTVNAGPASIALAWVRVLYTVALTETGLPAGTSWSASVGGAVVSGSSSALPIDKPNGTFGLTVPGVPGYVPVNYPVQVVVRGSAVVVPIVFSPTTFTYTFSVSGLPADSPWSVDAQSSGIWHNVTGTSAILALDLSNGTWQFRVGLPNGFQDGTPSHQLTVAGAAGYVTVSAVVAAGYAEGTVRPTGAQVLIDGAPVALSAGAFNVSLAPGVHSIEVTAPGYAAVFENFSVQSQATVPFDITLALAGSPAGSSPNLFGIPPLLLVALGVAVIVAIVAIALWRRRA